MIYGKLWLIEEHVTESPYGGAEKIQWKKIVTADEAEHAFVVAESFHREDNQHGFCSLADVDGGYSFAYDVTELEVLVPNYLWGASDGSSMWYEIRYLGELRVNMNWGSEKFGSLRLIEADK